MIMVDGVFGKIDYLCAILFVRVTKTEKEKVAPTYEFLGKYLDSILGQYRTNLFLEKFLASARSYENRMLDQGGIDIFHIIDQFRVALSGIDASYYNKQVGVA